MRNPITELLTCPLLAEASRIKLSEGTDPIAQSMQIFTGRGAGLTKLHEIVPVPKRSPDLRLQPPTVW